MVLAYGHRWSRLALALIGALLFACFTVSAVVWGADAPPSGLSAGDIGSLFGSLGANFLGNATLQALVIVTVADFILGSIKAVANDTFRTKWLDAWVGDHLLKVTVIVFGLLFGIVAPPIVIGNFSLNMVGAAAETAAATYIVKTGMSVLGNFNFDGSDAPPASVSPAP